MGTSSDIAQRRGLERATRVMEAQGPSIGREFARVTHAVLRDFKSDVDYQVGLLNGDGGPLEFSCSNVSDEVRYTLELGAMPPRSKVGHAHDLLVELGCPSGSEGVRERLEKLQITGTLRWGAWLGVRHANSATSFKIYAEVPPEATIAAAELLGRYCGPIPAVSGKRPKLVLVGQAPGSSRCEFYFELPGRELAVVDLEKLMGHVGLRERRSALAELVGSFEFRRGRCGLHDFPQAQWGFSLSLLPGGGDPVFSLIAFARDLMGGDGLLRWQFLQGVENRGWIAGCYESLSAPLAVRDFVSGFHNMVSFTVGHAPHASIQLSLSPPPEELDDSPGVLKCPTQP